MTLLWTNSSTAAATSVTISATEITNYDKYDIFAVECLSRSTDTIKNSEVSIAIKDSTTYSCIARDVTDADIVCRKTTVSSSGMSFSNGYNGTTAGGKYCLPYRIYGLDGIKKISE